MVTATDKAGNCVGQADFILPNPWLVSYMNTQVESVYTMHHWESGI